jgi:hypothetical protein
VLHFAFVPFVVCSLLKNFESKFYTPLLRGKTAENNNIRSHDQGVTVILMESTASDLTLAHYQTGKM